MYELCLISSDTYSGRSRCSSNRCELQVILLGMVAHAKLLLSVIQFKGTILERCYYLLMIL